MVAWWEAMTLIEQIFGAIAIAATVLLVVQIVLTLIGASGESDASGGGGDIDVDFDVDAGGGADIPADGGFDFEMPDVETGGFDLDFPDGDLPGHTASGVKGGGSMEVESGAHGAGLRLFTMQGFVAFFAIFGWSGLILLKSGAIYGISLLIAGILGFLSMVFMALMMRSMVKLQSDGTLNIRNAIGKSGEVYLPIYENRKQAGKVSLMVQNRLVEMEAVTDQDTKIPTGAQVTVVGIANNNMLIVKQK